MKMMTTGSVVRVIVLLKAFDGLPAFADDDVVAKYDPRMAAEKTVVDTNGVKWIDGRSLPLEGKAFADVEWFYDRLPANISTNVNGGVRSMKHHTSGMQFRFKTDSRTLKFRWKPYNQRLARDHMPSTGVSGIDIYRFDSKRGKWLYVKTGRITDAEKGGALDVGWTPNVPCLVNLPLYNGIRVFKLGIDENATIGALPSRMSGVDKPVVFYGTSITHGAAVRGQVSASSTGSDAIWMCRWSGLDFQARV